LEHQRLETTASTNDVARARAMEGAPHGSVISAETQQAGRGRLGRAWWSPPSGAALMSVILRPTKGTEHVAAVALEAGLAVVEALADQGVEARVKWPNDIWIGGKKAGGILCELVEDAGGGAAVIVGVGLNVNVAQADFPPELQASATSLREASGWSYELEGVILGIRDRLLTRFATFEDAGLDVASAERLSVTVGARVRDEAGREGLATGIASSGALKVRWDGADADAEVIAGDVTVAAA
jgi:BirA family biotin operon repressor/biotin-[acetyl-CoA-carboxylase] ligase